MGRVGALAPKLEDGGAVDFTALRPSSSGPVHKRMQAVAAALGARDFCLFSVLASVDSLRLVPLASSSPDYASSLKRQYSSLATVTEAATPAVWLAEGDEPPATLSRWTRWIDGPGDGHAGGIAFPLASERGGTGLAIFATRMGLNDDALSAAHIECYALFDEFARSRIGAEAGLPPLSKRELECLKMTADGLTSDEIARRLGLSVHTTNQYLANTTQKLNAVNRMHAVAKALRAGLFD
ncbi:MAG: helix-turn-helix transcriptional regulator [Rhizobiaceae bacterium]